MDDIEGEYNQNANDNTNNNADSAINRNLNSPFRHTSSAGSTNLPTTNDTSGRRTPVPINVGDATFVPMLDSIFPREYDIVCWDVELTEQHANALLVHDDDQFHLLRAEEYQQWLRIHGEALQDAVRRYGGQ